MRLPVDDVRLDYGYEEYAIKSDETTWGRECNECEVGLYLRAEQKGIGNVDRLFTDDLWRWDLLSAIMNKYCDERCECERETYL